MGLFWQEDWSGLPFPPPGHLPTPGIETESPDSYISRWIVYHWATWEAKTVYIWVTPKGLMKIMSSWKRNLGTVPPQSYYMLLFLDISSVQSLSCVRLLWPHGLQHTRPPCLSPTAGVCSNSCPLSRWCHPTISSSVISFSSCLQSFPASGSFPLSQFFASSGQSIGISSSASLLPMNTQVWSLYDGLVGSPCSPKDSQESFPAQFESINSSVLSLLNGSTLTSGITLTTGITIALTIWTFVGRVISLLFTRYLNLS